MTNPKHTSSDLVERLRYTAEHGIFTAHDNGMQAMPDEAADRIEALEAEVERWKELLHRSADQIYSLTGDFGSEDNDLADEIRAALEARHD